MKRGVILLAVIIAIGLVFFFLSQNNNFMTSFAAKTDGIDVNIDLFPLSREIKQGEDIRVSARIDTRQDELVDVVISYTITNNKGIVVFQKSKTLAVERTAKVTDNLMIHRSLGSGTYLVDVEASYDGTTKRERDTFTVVGVPAEPELGKYDSAMLLILIVLFTIFVILLWIHNRRVSKMVKDHEKCDIEHIMKS